MAAECAENFGEESETITLFARDSLTLGDTVPIMKATAP
jgi:hypothetical protein